MGYYTDFELSFNSPANREVITESLVNISGYDNLQYQEMNAKWYNWKEDMLELSKLYPEVLFTLEGSGEEKEDQWKAYFKGGKSQIVKAVITFEKFGESELK